MRFIFHIIFLLLSCTGFAQVKHAGNYFDQFVTDAVFKSAHLGVSVYDPINKKFLHSYQSDKYFVPASNTKIITCYAALKYLPGSLSLEMHDTYVSGMGAGWAWNDYNELEDPYPEIPFMDSGEVWSGPLDSLLRPMMYRSDNYVAQQLLQMASRQKLGKINEEIIIDTIRNELFNGVGIQPTWVDGCGLSRYNLFTPLNFIHALDKMQKEFGMQRMKIIFPSANNGTLKNYYLNDTGGIYAKTGSLTGVIALSGYIYTVKNKLLIFSVLVNNHNQPSSLIRRRIEKFIHALRVNN